MVGKAKCKPLELPEPGKRVPHSWRDFRISDQAGP